MRPLGFQTEAADQIAKRFGDYAADPLTITRAKNVPFLQMLVAITGSGKTLMLAETVSRMQAHLPRQPIVLWLSKGRVVVGQTYANLAHGRYADNIPGFNVKPLLELAPSDIDSAGTPLMLVATVGKFAQRDQEASNLRIYDAQLDLAQDSLWDLLKRRRSPDGVKRPLIVIYDEGQNLSDLQTERLLELGPDALISASATPVVPKALVWIMDRLRKDKDWQEEDFRTKVSSAEVVLQGLVKKRISIGGYVTPMETAVDALLQDMKDAAVKAAEVSQPFRPKAIYVASTNTVDGVPISEDVKRPFEQRQARPIVIWRHLVAAGIDHSKIAVYSQLKFDKDVPPPRTFRLFGGAERDYAQFMAGDFEHIIFNLALEEGWDDPMCGFAYIDKEMASARQITQVIGRVLRQPGAAHFAEPILNTAHFYIRADEKGVFEDIIDQVRLELASEHPSVEFTIREENRRASTFSEPPTRTKTVPTIAILSKPAREPIRKDVGKLMDFRGGGDNTVGRGARMQILQEIGAGDAISYEWIEIDHSNPLSARTVFRRELQRLYPGSLRRGGPINLVDIELPKFDALVEITSPAADHIRSIAADVVADYVGHSRLIQNEVDHPYFVGPVSVDPATAVPFTNAVHPRYSGLNDLELAIARAIDRTQRVWCRNQEGSGYFVPLLDRGSTGAFFPDFLVWQDKNVVAIETKGKHLISEDAPRKLFDISSTGDKAKLFVRMITKGRGVVSPGGQVSITGEVGATSWRWENGRLAATYHDEAKEAVDRVLQIED